MHALIFAATLTIIAAAAGLLGSLTGLGGGIVIVPVLTLAFHIDIRLAIGASLIAVIASSCGAAVSYVDRGLANLRLALVLTVATTAGALTGALAGGLIPSRVLYVLFGAVLVYSAAAMYAQHQAATLHSSDDWLANRLQLHGEYIDEATGSHVHYHVIRTPLGLGLMYIAGVVSALLGVGAGTLKVPALDLGMRVPLKASTATSSLMIGITAAAGAAVYFARGEVSPLLAAPVAIGVLAGAMLGARLFVRARSEQVRVLFVVILLGIASQMLKAGIMP